MAHLIYHKPFYIYIILASLIASVYCASFAELGGALGSMNLFKLLNRSNAVNNVVEHHVGDKCTLRDPDKQPLPARRMHFGSDGTSVYGWPSSGGVWVHKSCYGVELDFLGLPRFETSPTLRESDPDQENAFCKRLQWIGARYFESDAAYRRYKPQSLGLPTPARPWFGWPGAVPEGGVWALWPRHDEESDLGVGRIRNAHTMEERCKAIEMLGGKFYQNFEDVEEPQYEGPDDHEL